MRSAVAGIVNKEGGLRVVVTQRWRMRQHLSKGERLFVVPDYEVDEPVPWNDVPSLVERVQEHVVKTLAPDNACGSCTACCFTTYVEEGNFKKPSNSLCPHCKIGFGCKIYQSRPKVCSSFKCLWLKSQSRNDVMGPELRPDRCGCFFSEDSQTGDPLIIEVHGKPNADAWRWINEVQAAGYKAREIGFYVGEKR